MVGVLLLVVRNQDKDKSKYRDRVGSEIVSYRNEGGTEGGREEA